MALNSFTNCALSAEPVPVPASTSSRTRSGYWRAKFSTMLPPIEKPPSSVRSMPR